MTDMYDMREQESYPHVEVLKSAMDVSYFFKAYDSRTYQVLSDTKPRYILISTITRVES